VPDFNLSSTQPDVALAEHRFINVYSLDSRETPVLTDGDHVSITLTWLGTACSVSNGAILRLHGMEKQESLAVARIPRDAAAVLFGLKFAENILFKSSHASKARLQSSKHTGAKRNLTQNGHSRSFKVTCFGVSEKAIRE